MITISTENLMQIYKVCRPHLSKIARFPVLAFVQLLVENGKCVATACNGLSIAHVTVQVEGDDGEYLIPVVKIPKGSMYCKIDNTEQDMSVAFDSETVTRRKPEEPFIDWKRGGLDRLHKPLEYEIAFTPSVLSAAMASFKDETAVKLSFESNSTPAMISKGNARVLVVPTKPKEE